MRAAILLLFATLLTAPQNVSWMRPDAFHVTVGQSKASVEKTFRKFGWTLKAGKAPNHRIYEYDDARTVTLSFEKERLQWIRFEYVGFVPEVKKAFDAEKTSLARELGAPRKGLPANVIAYEERTPNVYVVLSTLPQTELGKQGLGLLAVRYFEPPPR